MSYFSTITSPLDYPDPDSVDFSTLIGPWAASLGTMTTEMQTLAAEMNAVYGPWTELQSSATDTTAGTIALQGNDAKFAAVSLTGQSLIFDSAGWPSTSILRSDTSGVQYIFGGTSGTTGATIALFGSTHATNPNLMVLEGDGIIFRAVDNTEYARFDNSGNLGIGTGIPSADLHVNGPIRCGSYTVATVPSAATVGAGTIIYVTDEIGGATHAASDGTNWRRMSDRAIIS